MAIALRAFALNLERAACELLNSIDGASDSEMKWTCSICDPALLI